MKNFFLNQNNDLIIEIFSIEHFLLISLTFLLVGLIINNKEKFINISTKNKRKLQISLAIILILNFILRRGSFIYYGVYDWHYHLDIGFCNFTSVMFYIYCITGNKKIYNICYYMTFVGPFMSILFPSVNISPLNYSFYSFIILHHLLFVFNIMFMYVENIIVNNKNFIKVIFFLILYLCITFLFNCIINTNYNNPLNFINRLIENSRLINILSYNSITIYFSFFLGILILLMIGKLFLKFLNNK